MLTDGDILTTIVVCENNIDDALIAVSEGRLSDAVVHLVHGLKQANGLNRRLIADRGERTKVVLESIDKLVDDIVNTPME